MFFVIPRVGQATLPFRGELGRRVAGFSERVELGAYGEIEADQTVVMRVRFPDSISEPFRLPNLRWRGLAFDRFDGRVWESSARQRTLLRREASGEFALATPRGTGPIVRQEIFLDPIGSDAVFAAPKALRIDTSAGAVGLDDMGSIVLPTVSTRLQYSVDSELEQTPPRGLRPAPWPVEGWPPRAHALPPASSAARAHRDPRPRRDGGQPQPLRGRAPADPVPLVGSLPVHPGAEAADHPRPAGGISLRAALGQLRVLRGLPRRHAAQRGHSRARGGAASSAASGIRTGATSWCA
jgi:hypothetical protein